VQSDRQPVSPFSRCPCPGYSGGQDTHRLIERWCPASAITQKSLRSFSQSVLDGLGVGQGTQALGKRPPPFYPSRLYWSSVLCSPFWLVRCRTLPATVSSAVLAPILIGIKAPCPRGRCVVCTRQASLRSCCWLLLLLWFVPGLASSSWASCGLEVLDL
jgi:hypothetical protein